MNRLLTTLLFGFAAWSLAPGSAFAHGCHAGVAQDQYGWHRHGPDCERIQTHRDDDHGRYGGDGEAYREHREYRDGYGDRREPQCVKKCHYEGPFKECRWICD